MNHHLLKQMKINLGIGYTSRMMKHIHILHSSVQQIDLMTHHIEQVQFIFILLENVHVFFQFLFFFAVEENAFMFDDDNLILKKARLSQKTICMISRHGEGETSYYHYDVHSLYGYTQSKSTNK